jgi:Fibronectin type III domain/N-acetylmuramoyl-L-alanine amidase
MKSIFFYLPFLLIFPLLSSADSIKYQGLQGEKIRGKSNIKSVKKRPWERVGKSVTGPIVTRISKPTTHQKQFHTNYPGPLAGKSVYLSPGHGWYFTGSYWTTQRGLVNGIVEDFSNAETIDQVLVPCLLRAGAHVVPVREIDLNNNMTLVDNDDGISFPQRGKYTETGDSSLFSDSSLSAFGYGTPPYPTGLNPFDQGTNRLMLTASEETARITYTLNVPEDGYYNIYISYTAYSERAPDAHYVVYHPGGTTDFRVDQTRHGMTWVLLGKFWFMKGSNQQYGAVALLNDSAYAGPDIQVSADAVRIGGGMGLIERGGSSSGYPRFEECCRYHAQFSGAPTSVYDTSSDDHSDDITCRSRMAAWVHETGEEALYLSYHTNAGGGRGTSTYVYSSNGVDGSYHPGQGTQGSDEFAQRVQSHVVAAASEHFEIGWSDRGLRSAYFGELNPVYHDSDVPAALVEALFHDSIEDTVYYREPWGRNVLGRALCHAVIHYFADVDGITPIFPPEPPMGLKVYNDGLGSFTVAWNPPLADSVGGDSPDGYKVYLGPLATAFDEGTTTNETSITFNNVQPGQVLYVKVAAVNGGGESPSTSPAAIGISQSGKANVLILDGFNKLDSSMNIIDDFGGDPVHRLLLRKMNSFRHGINKHAPELGNNSMAFDTWQIEATIDSQPQWEKYELVDFITGRGFSEFPDQIWNSLNTYVQNGGNLFVSGSTVIKSLQDANRSDLVTSLLGISSTSGISGNISITYDAQGLFSGITNSPLNDGEITGYFPGELESITPQLSTPADIYYSPNTPAGHIFQSGSGRVVMFGFPFENIENNQTRDEIISTLIDEFDISTPNAPDGGVDTGPDSSTDSGNDIDDSECGPEKECHTETVVGCHCNIAPNSSPSTPSYFLFLLFISLGIIFRPKCKS